MRNKVFYMGGALLVVAALITVAALLAGAAAAQGQTPTPEETPPGTLPAQPRTLSVSGSGETFLTPDIAYINIGVHTEGEDAAEAVSRNTERAQRVIDALVAFGIAERDIQTTNFSIYPRQEYDPQGNPLDEITYLVDNTVYVTVRDISQIGELLDAAVQSGSNSINGIQFDVADRAAALAEARQAAVANARAQAEELAAAAGVELVQVQSISTYDSGVPPVYYARDAVAMEAAQAAVPISPGQMKVSVNVNVVYEIR